MGVATRRTGRLVAGGLFAAWAVGQLARDRTWPTGLCFYLPSPVVAGVLLGFAGRWAVARRRAAWAALAAAVPPLAVVGLVENDFRPKPAGPSTALRLVHWNVGGRLSDRGMDVLAAETADVYVLSEVPGDRVGGFRDRLGPGWQSAIFDNLAVVGRGGVRADGWRLDRGRAKVQSVTWTPAGRPVRLLVVDLPSEVWVARDPLLRRVNELTEECRPDLVVGDFNAPRRSRGLTDLPAGYAHAYHTAGGGWGYTWPAPLPVYALDHCLHGPGVVPGGYRLGGLLAGSDHRYQVFDFSPADD